MIEFRDVHKHYDAGGERIEVLTGLSLAVAAGETVALTGDSGSGKTTLLHLAAGFDAPDRGRVRVAGQDLSSLDDRGLSTLRRRSLGMVFQQYNLLTAIDVGDNLRFPLRLLGRDDPAWLEHLVERLGLGGLLGRYPDQLSGGQQQRVALARALVHRPAVVLADEPTGNLDEDNSEAVMQLLVDLVAESGTTLLMVSHSAAAAAWLSRTLRLDHGRVRDA